MILRAFMWPCFYIDFSRNFMLWPDPVGAFLAPFQAREVGRLGLSSVASTPASGAPALFILDPFFGSFYPSRLGGDGEGAHFYYLI